MVHYKKLLFAGNLKLMDGKNIKKSHFPLLSPYIFGGDSISPCCFGLFPKPGSSNHRHAWFSVFILMGEAPNRPALALAGGVNPTAGQGAAVWGWCSNIQRGGHEPFVQVVLFFVVFLQFFVFLLFYRCISTIERKHIIHTIWTRTVFPLWKKTVFPETILPLNTNIFSNQRDD